MGRVDGHGGPADPRRFDFGHLPVPGLALRWSFGETRPPITTRRYADGVGPLPLPLPTTLAELVDVLDKLPDLDPLARALMVRRLDKVARRILGDVGDAAVVEAHQPAGPSRRALTYAQIGEHLGVTPERIGNTVWRYRKRVEG